MPALKSSDTITNLPTRTPDQESVSSSDYVSALSEAMTLLGQDPRTIFLGQAVKYPGTAMFHTLEGVPDDKRIEMPVAEELQMGMTVGLAISSHIPVSIYPRWNFLLLAANQLVNHLDRLSLMSNYRPSAIIRVGVGSSSPMDPGIQHLGDFTNAFEDLLKTTTIWTLNHEKDILPDYMAALEEGGIHLMVEYMDLYNG